MQGASRPRTGLSPPEQIARRSDVIAEPPLPDASGPRAHSRRLVMPVRRLPVRPDLEQLSVRPRNCSAPFTPAMRMRSPNCASTIPNRSTRLPRSWPTRSSCSHAATRLRAGRGSSTPCSSSDAIWRDDLDTVRALVTRNPALHPRACPDSHRQQLGPADDVRGEPWPRPHHPSPSQPRRQRLEVGGRTGRAPGQGRDRCA